ncbi:hypothetical protein FACS1894110_07240 [Spirochaetia bacterium]|nr:hypothetical protein FACS1894110_07240 [Spirochaetia bacterium]
MKKTGLLLFLLLTAAFCMAQSGGRRFALVIGNSTYARVEALINPANDASDVAAKLRALGYQVDLRLNAGNAEITRAVTEYTRLLAGNSANEGFFWFAGHGVQINGENYLLPVDIDADDDISVMYGSYPLNRLLDSLEHNAQNKINVVVIDACRDNPFKNRPGGSRSLTRGLVTVDHAPQDLFMMFSTAPGAVAADGEKGRRNSPFAEAFLKFMDSTEILSVVASHITRETMTLTGGKQRPFQNGSIVSEVYYSLNPASNSASSAAPTNYSAAPVRVSPVSLAPIPAGTFTMGSPASEAYRDRDEVQHEVSLKSFLMEAYEVTQKSYREIMGINPSSFQGDTLPVEQVSWFDAVNYCNKRSIAEGLNPAYVINGENVSWNRSANGYRLPTEAEWEYACRAGSSAPFSTGNTISTGQANYRSTGNVWQYEQQGSFRERTSAVGSFLPNTWGLYDMHGNVYEWCWDWFGDYPDAPSTGTKKVIRGGSWYYSVINTRAAYRDSSAPVTRQNTIGFRVTRNGE